jgi:hypothetical protein
MQLLRRNVNGLANTHYSMKITSTPRLTSRANSNASQLVRRMHPTLCEIPICEGSGVP